MTTESETTAAPEEPDRAARRRAMLGLLVAGVAAGTITSAKDAKAQLFGGGGLDFDFDGLEELIALLLTLFRTGNIVDPLGFLAQFLGWLQEITAMPAAASTLSVSNVHAATERSYPTEPPEGDTAQLAASLQRAEDIDARVRAANSAAAAVVEMQPDLAAQEEAIYLAGTALESGLVSVPAAISASLAMLMHINTRLGHLAILQAETITLLADQTQHLSYSKGHWAKAIEKFLGPDWGGGGQPPERYSGDGG